MEVGGVIKAVLGWFTPPDPKISDFIGPEATMSKAEGHLKHAVGWGQRISSSFALLVIALFLAVVTPWGVVLSSDMDKKVEAAVKKLPLTQQVSEMRDEQKTMKSDIGKVKADLDTMSPMLKEIFKSSTATTICRLLAAKLRVEADNEQTKYKAIDGDYYPESRCGAK